MKADIGVVALDYEVFDEPVEMGTGHHSSRTLVFVYRAIGRSKNRLESANHSAEAPGWAAEEEVGLNRNPDMRMVMHRVRLAVEGHCSLARDVCPVRLAADGYILESLAVEDQLGLA